MHGHALVYVSSKSPDLPPMPDGTPREHAELASIPLEDWLHYPNGGLFDDEQLRILDTDAT